MYIRIQQQSIRYRITREEAENLLNGDVLLDALPLEELKSLSYSVEATEGLNKFEYSESNHSMSLKINLQALQKEVAERPSKQGIAFTHQISETKSIRVSLEVDLKRKRNA